MKYRLTTIERGEGFPDERRSRRNSNSLSVLVSGAERYGLFPGNVTGDGWTIIETVFESVAE